MPSSRKIHALYHRDNRTVRSGRRLEKLAEHLKKLDVMKDSSFVSEKWIKDARGKAMAKARKYGMKVS